MVVCRFYLAGNCKYGDRCFNEHPRGNGPAGGGGARTVTFRDSFGTAGNSPAQNPYKWTAPGSAGSQQQQQQQQASSISVQDIVRSLPKEMEVWQTSRMWPFSCFAMEKELPCLPEFMDMSPEELRLDAYNAIQQGTVEIFKQKVTQLAQEFREKQDQIRAMPDALQQKLTQILEEGRRQKAARASGQSVVRPSTFGGAQAGGSIFGAGTSSVFGSGPVSSSSSVFGGSSNNSSSMAGPVFGMRVSAAQSVSVFGQLSASAGSVFGGNQTSTAAGTGSVFGQPQPAPGLFGSGATSTTSSSGGSVFGGGGGMFAQPGGGGAMPAPGLFGKDAASGGSGFGQPAPTGSVFGQNPGSVFGQSPAGGAGLFGNPPASSSASVFGQPMTSSTASAPGLFGAGPSQSGVFGGSTATGSAGAPQPGLFRAAPSGATGSVFGGGSTFGGAAAAAAQSPVAESSSLYTPLAELTESERAQFQAKTFTVGMIPMRPPPKELINT